MARKKLYEKEFVLQGHYGQGWEDLTAESIRRDILARRKEYQENEGGCYRIIQRRVKVCCHCPPKKEIIYCGCECHKKG